MIPITDFADPRISNLDLKFATTSLPFLLGDRQSQPADGMTRE